MPGFVVAGALVVVAAIVVPGYRSLTSPSAGATSTSDVPHLPGREIPRVPRGAAPDGAAAEMPTGAGRSGSRGALGEADGAVPDGTTVFDDAVPAVAKLDRALLAALRRAATDAATARVGFSVDSGWRSPAYQQRLLDEAIARYGSEMEAARWVATPTTSAHVSGDAVDVGPAAAAWLSRHGARYGLCPIYRNEPWHYELRPAAAAHGCPAMYADASHDPRMQP